MITRDLEIAREALERIRKAVNDHRPPELAPSFFVGRQLDIALAALLRVELAKEVVDTVEQYLAHQSPNNLTRCYDAIGLFKRGPSIDTCIICKARPGTNLGMCGPCAESYYTTPIRTY